jgi:hypothetical protein
MSFSDKRGTDEAGVEEEIDRPRDLLCGIGPKHIRLLCDNPWDGGRGYRPSDVGDMTLDQIFFLICDRENLRGLGKVRKKSMGLGAVPAPGPDGLIAGRDSKGNPIRLPVKGESLVARLNREAQEKKAAAKAKDKKGRRRGT